MKTERYQGELRRWTQQRWAFALLPWLFVFSLVDFDKCPEDPKPEKPDSIEVDYSDGVEPTIIIGG